MIAQRRAGISRALVIRTLLVLGGSCLMTIGARFSVDIGTVPITGQTLALPLVVALLGTRQSTLAMLAYLAEGAVGIPVFAGAHAGPAILAGPTATTAGYLWSYPLAAWAIGTLYDAGFAQSYFTRWIAIFLGIGIVFVAGAAVLAIYVGPAGAFALGVVPFILGDLAKVTIAAGAPKLWPKLATLLRL
jgi:biotin transport system substrate-specific component